MLKRSEGLRLTAYRDVAGLLTIGYGHKVVPPAVFDNGITEATADAILANDVEAAEGAVTRLVKVPLTQGQFDALVDFTFNLGAGRLADSTLLVDLNAAGMTPRRCNFCFGITRAANSIQGSKHAARQNTHYGLGCSLRNGCLTWANLIVFGCACLIIGSAGGFCGGIACHVWALRDLTVGEMVERWQMWKQK